MKISELMEKLGELQGKHGDIEVWAVDTYLGSSVVETVEFVKEDNTILIT